MEIKTVCRFKGGFLTPTAQENIEQHKQTLTDVSDYFCWGLQSKFKIESHQWCDYEYIIVVNVDTVAYEVSVSYDFVSFEWFEVSYQPNYGFFAKLFGKNEILQMKNLSNEIHTLLDAKKGVTSIRWYSTYSHSDKSFTKTPF